MPEAELGAWPISQARRGSGLHGGFGKSYCKLVYRRKKVEAIRLPLDLAVVKMINPRST